MRGGLFLYVYLLDIIKVNNLKHGWQFIFDTIDYPLDLRYIRQINLEVGNGIVTDAGNLRTAAVSIAALPGDRIFRITKRLKTKSTALCSRICLSRRKRWILCCML